MDEIRITSKLLCGVIAKLFEVGIKKCCGIKVKINLGSLVCVNSEETATINVESFSMEMKSEDLPRMIFGKIENEEE